MAGSIDERIVEMTFKGSGFVSEIHSSVEALSNLKNSLNGMKSSTNDLNELNNSGKRFSLSGMISSVDSAVHHFSLLKIAGLTAFTSLVRQGLFFGEHLLASFTIDPIKAGLASYETKINAIQTILANTAAEGTNLKQVTAALNQLNAYSNLTVFNFADMTKNIGTFTAAGVHLGVAVASIKGIANLAALSGSSADQASTAMYQLSQAIAAGRVKLQDWNSVVNAGLGGKVFQNAILNTARVNGVAVDSMIKKYGGFRNSLQSGFLTAKILTQTLAQFTGDLSLKQIEAQGFTLKESEAIQKQAKIAVTSATQIRTISQLVDALKDDISTAWAGVFEAIIGNFSTAPKLLTGLFNTLSSVAIKPINDLAAFLTSFRHLGGFDLIIQTISESFHDLGKVLGVVGQAFREVFPSSGGGPAQGLIKITIAIQDFVQHLTPTKATLDELRTIFVGLFSAIKIVIDVISALVGGLFHMGSASKSAGGGFLAFVATIASFITRIKDAIESGHALANIFNFLGEVLSLPIKALGAITGYLGGLSGAANKGASAMGSFVQKVGQVFHGLADAIANGIKSGNFQQLTSLINSLLVGGILLKIKSFISGLGKNGVSGGLFATIKESFESLTTTLKTMQAQLKAGLLEKIAIAIGILAAALLVLSLINVANLVKALGAITVLFTELTAALALIAKAGGGAGILKITAIGIGLNLLATSILILSAAVAILARFSWSQLARGLVTIIGLLAALVATTLLLSKNTVGLIGTAIALNLIAIAINTLALAVGILGKMDLGTLAKGIGSIAVLLAILAGFNAISGAQLITTAASMVLLGVALNVIAKAVETLGALSVVMLAKGLGAIAIALVILAGATLLMEASLPGAAALLVVSGALVIMAQALSSLGGMSWSAIAKSLVELAGSLVILSVATLAMEGSLPGAAAILVVAAALTILTPVLIALGNLSWEQIAKGLVTLVGVFVILGAAGILLTPLVPTLLGLGLAIALLGVGILAAGAGVGIFAAALTGLALAVTASGAAILSFVGSILGLIPETLTKIGEGIVAFANAIGKGGAAIARAFEAIFSAIFDAIAKTAPKAEKAFDAVMTAVLHSVNKYAPKVTTTFLNLLLTLLNKATSFAPKLSTAASNLIIAMINGINRNIGRIVNAATNLIVNFINAIGNGTIRVVNAGVTMVIRVINGIANSIRNNAGEMRSAGANLGSAIVEGIIAGIEGLAGGVISAAESMARNALSAATSFLHINSPSKVFRDQVGASIPEGTALGIKDNQHLVTGQVETMGGAMLTTLGKSMAAISDTIDANLNLSPQITPVVDLTEAKKGFDALNGLSKSQIIAASATSSHASSISTANMSAAALAGLAAVSQTLNFNQTNNSPQALDAATIYRRTSNQISVAKGALKRANSSVSN